MQVRDDGLGKLAEYLSGKSGQEDTTTVVTAPSGEYVRTSPFGGKPSYTVTYSEDIFPTALKKQDMIQTLDNVHRRAVDAKEQGGVVKAEPGKKLSTPVSTTPADSSAVEYHVQFPGRTDSVSFVDTNGNKTS